MHKMACAWRRLIWGVKRDACIEALPEAKVGDYVIVHAGFALNTLSEDEAQETLAMFKEIERLDSAHREDTP